MHMIMAFGSKLLRIGSAAFRKFATTAILVTIVGLALLLWATNVQPLRLAGLFKGPTGTIYVSSPGVYTRERLVNDRNDQDFWLRSQMERLDKHEVPFAIVLDRGRTGGLQLGPAHGHAQTQTRAGAKAELPGSADPGDPTTGGPRTRNDPPFIHAFVVKSAWRDRIRHAILENLLDDRHDLTGNSVYGLNFGTTMYPGWYTSQRAFVRISISTDQAEFTSEDASADDEFPDLSSLVQGFYRNSYADVLNNRENPNYLSHTLYKRWLANVEWRLNSHFGQVYGSRCDCTSSDCKELSGNWDTEVARSVDTVLAISRAEVKRTSDAPIARVDLPKPWNDFLVINLAGLPESGCGNRPQLLVGEVLETVLLFKEKDVEDDRNYRLIESVDEKDGAYFHVVMENVHDEGSAKTDDLSKQLNATFVGSKDVTSTEAIAQPKYEPPHYRGYSSIARFLKKHDKNHDKVLLYNDQRYFTIPSGYFNFVDKVIGSDSYVYSLFPSSEADAVRDQLSGFGEFSYGSGEGAKLTATERVFQDRSTLERSSIGFADARQADSSASQGSKAINFGWVMETGSGGAALQKSQFALISVPAWVSRLTVTVRTGWLDSSSREIAAESYDYDVPIPPDYEAFDAFIGGEEAVRRPQINGELMDSVDLIACRPASILIPGLRLWRSAMVTLGSERAERITVLPNMEGIIAEFGKSLGRSMKTDSPNLRVWTSEGVDVLTGKVSIEFPKDMSECADDPPSPT